MAVVCVGTVFFWAKTYFVSILQQVFNFYDLYLLPVKHERELVGVDLPIISFNAHAHIISPTTTLIISMSYFIKNLFMASALTLTLTACSADGDYAVSDAPETVAFEMLSISSKLVTRLPYIH